MSHPVGKNRLSGRAMRQFLGRPKRDALLMQMDLNTHAITEDCYDLRITAGHLDRNTVLRCVATPSVQFSPVAQSCPTLCMDRSMPGPPVHHQLLELAQTHVDGVSDAIQPSHPLSSSSPAFSLSQHQGLFK